MGALLIDAMRAFNEGNRKMMVHIARHEWLSRSWVLFNAHRNHSALVTRGEIASKTLLLYSREEVAQGFSLAMVACAMLMLLFAHLLKITCLEITSV